MVLLFIRAPYYVLLVFIAMCAVFWLFWLSCQYLPSDWLERFLCVPILLCFPEQCVITITVLGASVTNLNKQTYGINELSKSAKNCFLQMTVKLMNDRCFICEVHCSV